MSRRGEITIECDVTNCYAEQIFTPDTLADTRNLDELIEDAGWKSDGARDICPQCVEENQEREELTAPDAWEGGFARSH